MESLSDEAAHQKDPNPISRPRPMSRRLPREGHRCLYCARQEIQSTLKNAVDQLKVVKPSVQAAEKAAKIASLAAKAATLADSRAVKSEGRSNVIYDFEAAKMKNDRAKCNPEHKRHLMANDEYIFQNQYEDAERIINLFKSDDEPLIVSVKKEVKLGANGLILALVKLMCTDPDDKFVINRENIRVLTGMSNCAWEYELREEAPDFLIENKTPKILHHGKLTAGNLKEFADNTVDGGLLIIDEIDTATQKGQRLDDCLKDAGLKDIEFLRKKRIYIVVISATIAKQLCELSNWGDVHEQVTMSVPKSYAGLKYFAEKGIIAESAGYDMGVPESLRKWLKEDVLDNYEHDYRVHLVRLPRRRKGPNGHREEPYKALERECKRLNIGIGEFNGTLGVAQREPRWREAFDEIQKGNRHYVMALKPGGLLKRATRIAECDKRLIGAIVLSPAKKPDYNVISQDLIGRMCGHWKALLDKGHKVGPIRVPLEAIHGYIKEHNDEPCEYKTRNYATNSDGNVVKCTPSALDARSIKNLPIEESQLGVPMPKLAKTDILWFGFETEEEYFNSEFFKKHIKANLTDEHKTLRGPGRRNYDGKMKHRYKNNKTKLEQMSLGDQTREGRKWGAKTKDMVMLDLSNLLRSGPMALFPVYCKNPTWTGAIDPDSVDPESLILGSLRWVLAVKKEIIKEEAITGLEEKARNEFLYGDGWEKDDWM